MSKCTHRTISAFHTADGEPVELWACWECKMKFYPADYVHDLEIQLVKRLRTITRLESDVQQLRDKLFYTPNVEREGL